MWTRFFNIISLSALVDKKEEKKTGEKNVMLIIISLVFAQFEYNERLSQT